MVAAHLTHDFGWGKQLVVQQDLHLAAHAPHLFSGHTQKEVSPAVGPMPRIRPRIASSNKPRLHEATTGGMADIGRSLAEPDVWDRSPRSRSFGRMISLGVA